MSIAQIYRALSNGPIQPIDKPEVGPKSGPKVGDGLPKGEKSEFGAMLTQELNLSQHAETRIRSRSIPWDAAIEKRISGGIDAAQAKGSRETLILAGDIAVIANVKSRTIITAMDKSQLKDKIFTNIDSAVLV